MEGWIVVLETWVDGDKTQVDRASYGYEEGAVAAAQRLLDRYTEQGYFPAGPGQVQKGGWKYKVYVESGRKAR